MSDAKRIVITGVSRGLGRALLEEFVRMGHHVAGCSRSAESIEELRAAFPSPHDFAEVDVSSEPSVAAWARRLLVDFGPPDLLINNAALMNSSAVLWEVAPAEFSRLIDVNVKGVFYVIRHILPAMIERGRGVVVNISSGWGRTTSPKFGPYCTTKWAVEGLSRALSSELPKGLACVALNPGVIHTEMLESCFGQMANSFPSPDAWAKKAAPFVLSLAERHNGESLTVPS